MASDLFDSLYATAARKDCAVVTTLEKYFEIEDLQTQHVVDLVRLATRMLELNADFLGSLRRFPVLPRLAFTHRCPNCGSDNCGNPRMIKLPDYDQHGRRMIYEVS